jgi:hypothetical protein
VLPRLARIQRAGQALCRLLFALPREKSSISRHLGSVTAGAAGGPPAGVKILTTFSSGGRI